MKKSVLMFCPVLLASLGMLFMNERDTLRVNHSIEQKRLTAMGCAPGADEYLVTDNKQRYIGILPGWGDHSYIISTGNDSAQVFFNQGLSMYYSYHVREAIASFRQATRFDSTNAMIYWGQALAMGPTYNFGYAYKMNPNVPAVINAMNRLAVTANSKELDLINAMNKRYDITDTADDRRKLLNVHYAEALKPLVIKYPDDIDIKALYVDAVMLLHSWDFWSNDGNPKPWTHELVNYCEEILAKDPHHPAALHYYIHVTEASRKPEVALASADSLIKLFPGVAHMVHMSSHEYERIGYYAKGVHANEMADRSLVVYDSLAKGLFPQVHVPHYYAVDAYCALSGAMYKKGIQKSLLLRQSVTPSIENHYMQYQYMFPQLAMVRMGKWNDILKDKTNIKLDWIYASILNDFAKGMAYAKTGEFHISEKYLKQLSEKKKDERLKNKFVPHTSSPYECSEVAENILHANILFEQKDHNGAIKAIKKAILAEDSLIYSEPKIWMLPARQYLGSFLMQMKNYKEAEKVYSEDLVWNPGNGWSLLGLHQSLKAQNKRGELRKLKKLYMNSFSESEVVPLRSAY